MFGKTMISREIGTGTSFINIDGETGRVVSPEDPQALAQAIDLLLENEADALRLGRAARQRYEQLFSGDALGAVYAELYRETLNTRPRASSHSVGARGPT